MSDAGRLLRLLSLLQARPYWAGPELAARLGVTPRTVRRDIDHLRRLGYPVNAVPGPAGGYELGGGAEVPPLLLDDEEAVAVAVGLRAAADGSVSGLGEAAVSALAKLDQILPARLAGRVADVHAATVQLWGRDPEGVDAVVLVAAARACRRSERLRFAYTARSGEATRRLVEPFRLVRTGPRWYLVARDVDRGEWRTFRVDRMAGAEGTGERFERVDPPDPAALVAEGLAVAPYPFRAVVRLALPLAEALAVIPRTVGVATPDGDSTVIELGAGDEAGMVRYLASMREPCEVLEPASLRSALREHASRVAERNG
ncbi:MAG TPA: WYL domain-containing protein [Actinomycetota bacterium]|nr:WYL domain-containing protein [Actinomycetota bacterium]